MPPMVGLDVADRSYLRAWVTAEVGLWFITLGAAAATISFALDEQWVAAFIMIFQVGIMGTISASLRMWRKELRRILEQHQWMREALDDVASRSLTSWQASQKRERELIRQLEIERARVIELLAKQQET